MNPKNGGKTAMHFSPERVREIKKALMAGASAVAIARVYGCGAETIRRIKRGETHNGTRVEGEDILRVAIEMKEVEGELFQIPVEVDEEREAYLMGRGLENLWAEQKRVSGEVKGGVSAELVEMKKKLMGG